MTPREQDPSSYPHHVWSATCKCSVCQTQLNDWYAHHYPSTQQDVIARLRARGDRLARALDQAITTLEYQGGASLIVEELRRAFYNEPMDSDLQGSDGVSAATPTIERHLQVGLVKFMGQPVNRWTYHQLTRVGMSPCACSECVETRAYLATQDRSPLIMRLGDN